MDEYDELWDRIEKSPFMGVYIAELYWLARYVEEECAKLFREVQPSQVGGQGYIRVDAALHGRILSVLGSAARLRALIREREGDGSRQQREVLARRVARLRQLLAGIDLDPVLDGAARNSIEHFDEYLDGVAIKSARGVISAPTLFGVDVVLGSRQLLETFDVGGEKPTTYSIRAYFADERVFSNCGRELRLDRLADSCAEIRVRLEPALPEVARDDRGASMLVVTKETFGA